MRPKISILICALLLASVVLPAQDLVFTKASSKIFTQEELRALIQHYAFQAVKDQKVPKQLFETEYKKLENQFLTEARPRIMQAFRWVERTGSVLTQEKRNGMYKQELRRAVRDVVLTNPAFKSLVAVDQTDRIISFANEVKVNSDGWLTVTELITIYNGSGEQSRAYLELNPGERAVNNDIQRGLERTFPTNYVNEYGLQTKVPFEVIAVYKNEQPENFMVADYGNGALLRIGSAEKYLEDGVYEYKIQYRTNYQLKFNENKTELYWNVNGNGWVFTADSVWCTITFPTGSKIFEQACYTGVQGSTTKNCTSKIINDSTIWFSTNQRLQSYEGLTVAAAIQPGIVSQPSYAALSIQLLKYNWALAVIALVMSTMFIINLINWIKFGRDPKQGVIVPGFEPPVNSPAAAGFIYNQKFKTEQFSAALVDLAVKKAITIQVKKEGSLLKKNTYLFKKGSAAASIKAYAKTAYNWNLENLYDLKADGSYNRMFESLHSNLQQHLTAKYQTDGLGGNKTQGFFARNSGAATWGFTAWFITLIFAFVTIAPIATETLTISAAVLLSVGFITQFIFYKIMPAYNAQGRKLLDALLGFRMYLATAEEKRFNKLNQPERNLELFERFLPYAIALNCQHEWSQKFEALLKSAIADKSYQPAYYSSNDMHENVSFSSISNSFSSSLSSTIASSSTAPSDSSSSGSDGGGSSGGGGGGGGGGGW
ncbi:MAG: DUF2207 domain-containing protein [Cyclobacteriaceae bacterium]|nr:DUF2207 domain-containing protein [Cyclobacteriaceae bacterium]